MKGSDLGRYIDGVAPAIDLDEVALPRVRQPEPGRRVLLAALGVLLVLSAIGVGLVADSNGGRDGSVTASKDLPGTAIVPSSTARPGTATTPEGPLDVDEKLLQVAVPGRVVTLQLTDEAAAATPTVHHQAGFVRDGYGYDIDVSVGEDGLGPCLGATPCVEVGTGYETAGGMFVRSWAADLLGVPGVPSSPTYITATSPDDITLTIRSRYEGGALSGADIAGLLAVDSTTWLGLSLGPNRQPLSWNGTFVNPPPVDGTVWSVYLSPTCDGSDLCDDGVGVSSMAPVEGTQRALSELVSQTSTEPG